MGSCHCLANYLLVVSTRASWLLGHSRSDSQNRPTSCSMEGNCSSPPPAAKSTVQPGLVLLAVSPDPLLEAGGLEQAAACIGAFADLSDEDNDHLEGDSDDNDWDFSSSSSGDDDVDQVAFMLPALANHVHQGGAQGLLSGSDDDWALAHD